MIVHNLGNRKNSNILKNSIYQELMKFWYRYHIYHHATYTSVIHEINLILHAISQERNEYGLERILYSLNDDLPCLSPFFEKHYIFGLERFSDVIEKELAEQKDDYIFTMDRHMIAYISIHHRHISRAQLRQASDIYDKPAQMLAQANILSILQKEYGKKPYPNTCRTVCNMLELSVKKFKNLQLQQRLHKRIFEQSENGDISNLLSIINDARVRRQDEQAYRRACSEYRDNSQILSEVASIREHLYHDAHNKALNLSVTSCAITGALGLLAFLI
jgi:hypothetical protein